MKNEITEEQYNEALIIQKHLLENLEKVNATIEKYQTQYGDLVGDIDLDNSIGTLHDLNTFQKSEKYLMQTEENTTEFIASLRNGGKKDIIVDMVKLIEKNDKSLDTSASNGFGESDLDEMFG